MGGPLLDTTEIPDGAEASAPAPRRKRGRTALIIAVAAVLGIVGGTAVGYGIQAHREPTPLAALNQPDLRYPKPLPKGQKLEPLSSDEDRSVRTDGDLRKLLLPKPSGAKAPEVPFGDGWVTLPEYATNFNSPAYELEYQLQNKVRRIATTAWRTGEHRTTEIRLVQYRPSDVMGARDHADDQMGYMPQKGFAGTSGDPIPGSANGHSYVFPVKRKAGYMDFYQARAYFHRGDIMAEIFVFDTEKISKKDIASLAALQLRRL